MSKKYIINGGLEVRGTVVGGKDNLVLLDNSYATGANNTIKVLALPQSDISNPEAYPSDWPACYVNNGYLQDEASAEYYGIKIHVSHSVIDLNDVLSATQLSSDSGEHLVNWIEDIGYIWITILCGENKSRYKLSITLDEGTDEYVIKELRIYTDDTQETVDLIAAIEDGSALVLLQGGLLGEEVDAGEFGFSTYASGAKNQAGIGSTVVGLANRAVGYISYAEGHNTEAIGEYAHAQNWTTSAVGVASTAMGGRTVASGQYSTATGGYTKAKGDYSFAGGSYSKSDGNASIALGSCCTSVGSASFSAGGSCLANKNYTVALGHASAALAEGSIAIGRECIAGGTATHQGSGVFNITQENNGTRNFAGGYKSIARGDQAFAFGKDVQATSKYSVAFGNGAKAQGEGSMAVGDATTKTEASYSVAFGSEATVGSSGSSGFAVGRKCSVNGYAAVAMGHTAAAGASYSIAIGHGVTASNECSIAMGHRAAATGKHAIAIGSDSSSENDPKGSQALGVSSVAIIGGTVLEAGNNSVAIGQGASVASKRSIATHGSIVGADSDNSVAMCGGVVGVNSDNSVAVGTGATVNDGKINAYALGQNCVANRNYQMVVGRNNEQVTGPLFVVGGGNSSARWNLFEAGQDNETQQTIYAKIGKTKLYESALKKLLAVEPFETTLTLENVPERIVTVYGQDYHMDTHEGRTETLYSHGEALTITLKERYSSSEKSKVYLNGTLVADLDVGQSHTLYLKKKNNTIKIS